MIDDRVAFDGPFSRNEIFIDARNAGDTATAADLEEEGRTELRARRPRRKFSAKINESDIVRYGIDYRLGYLVTAQAKGLSFDCRVTQVHVTVDSRGETIESVIEGGEDLDA